MRNWRLRIIESLRLTCVRCICSLPSVDIAVDPLDGTTACATGKPGAVAVIALAERGALFDPGPAFYMSKLAVGPEAAEAIDIRFGALHSATAHPRQTLSPAAVVCAGCR